MLENLTKIPAKDIINYIFIFYAHIMYDTKTAKSEFKILSHAKKLKKVKETLQLLSKKSPFFADLWNHFKTQEDIQENALDAMYSVVMNLVFTTDKK